MTVTHVLGSIRCINTCCPFSIHAGCIEWHIHVIYTGNTMYSSFFGVFAKMKYRGMVGRCIYRVLSCILDVSAV
jgi:hypothetical protein